VILGVAHALNPAAISVLAGLGGIAGTSAASTTKEISRNEGVRMARNGSHE
jgi:hypothetical protein